MECHPVRVLLVEDDDDDFFLTRDLFQEIKGNPFQLERAATYEAALEALRRNQHDVYLLDYRLGPHDGLQLLSEAVRIGCRAPIIFLTGQEELKIDMEAMRAGAADYLIKDQIQPSLLERSIRYAIRHKEDQEKLCQARLDLERRVDERTAALDQANRDLQAEITDRKRLEQELRQRADQLADADRRKDEFLAMLAHELRNPLAPIRHGLHILRMPHVQGTTNDRVLHIMEQELHTVSRLVDDLLDVSRITRGKIQLRMEKIDLAEAVTHAVEMVRPLIETHRHELSISLPRTRVHLMADPTRLEQVLLNLLNNATKYTEEGGQIHLSVERDRNDMVLRVRDTGIGISPEFLPHVFDLFTQVDQSLARSQGGLGIGLTMVRKLLEMMGGSVSAHSDGPGKGSEFVVRLPALPQEHSHALREAGSGDPRPARDAGGPEETQPSHRPLRVLVAEDAEFVAEMLVMLLKLWGHDVRAVNDGPAALNAARTYEPDVILLDIGLPGINGYDVARQLRGETGRKRPLIAAVTGYGQQKDRVRSQESGFDLHMVKPINPNALEAFLTAAEALRKKPVSAMPGAC